MDSVDLVVPLEFVSDESPPAVAGSTPKESEVVAVDGPALVVVAPVVDARREAPDVGP